MRYLRQEEVDIGELIEADYNPRTTFSDSRMADLVESIRKVGLLEPLLGRRMQNGTLETIAGNRRLKAIQRLSEEGDWDGKVQVQVYEATDEEAMELSYRENKDRDNLSPIEDARFLAEAVLRAAHRMKEVPMGRHETIKGEEVQPNVALSFSDKHPAVKAVSEQFGVSAKTIDTRLKLLFLPEDILPRVGLERDDPHYLLVTAAYELARLRQVEPLEKAQGFMREIVKEIDRARDRSADPKHFNYIGHMTEAVKNQLELEADKKKVATKELSGRSATLCLKVETMEKTISTARDYLLDLDLDEEEPIPEILEDLEEIKITDEDRERWAELEGVVEEPLIPESELILANANLIYDYLSGVALESLSTDRQKEIGKERARLRDEIADIETGIQEGKRNQWRCPYCLGLVNFKDLARKKREREGVVQDLAKEEKKLSKKVMKLRDHDTALQKGIKELRAAINGYVVVLEAVALEGGSE